MPHPTPQPPACHPDRKHHARGLCRPCYLRAVRAYKLPDYPSCVDCRVSIKYRGRQARRCPSCVVAKRNSEQAAARPNKRAYVRNWKAAHKYKITPDENEALGFTCGVCGSENLTGGNRHIDHNHETGKIRGLLCRRCNTGIGMLGDTLEGVLRAAEYLR